MKYKNITKEDLFVPNLGLVKSGQIVNTKMKINNQNFEKVVEKPVATAPAKVEDKK